MKEKIEALRPVAGALFDLIGPWVVGLATLLGADSPGVQAVVTLGADHLVAWYFWASWQREGLMMLPCR